MNSIRPNFIPKDFNRLMDVHISFSLLIGLDAIYWAHEYCDAVGYFLAVSREVMSHGTVFTLPFFVGSMFFFSGSSIAVAQRFTFLFHLFLSSEYPRISTTEMARSSPEERISLFYIRTQYDRLLFLFFSLSLRRSATTVETNLKPTHSKWVANVFFISIVYWRSPLCNFLNFRQINKRCDEHLTEIDSVMRTNSEILAKYHVNIWYADGRANTGAFG